MAPARSFDFTGANRNVESRNHDAKGGCDMWLYFEPALSCVPPYRTPCRVGPIDPVLVMLSAPFSLFPSYGLDVPSA